MMTSTLFGRRSLLALALPLLALAMLFSACSDDEGGGDADDGDETTTATSDSGSDDETATATEDDATGTAGTATGTATGTAGAGGGTTGGGEVDLEMVDIAFSVEQLEATAGEPLSLSIENTGALEHDFTIEEGSFSDVSAEGGEDASGEEYPIHYVLQAGESGSLTFTADEAGEYTFFCTVPGHREAGMEGTLTVQ